ncbi:MAG: deoxyribodipyrimidine photo-lyase [Bacilli bacterium]|nr:deoxyribodipyrimidine photo-lyase [Bacilli bacterium]MDD4808505.1 deoxyribodipyrimidine photo-lyase [Bacilli bacterium]
MFYKDRINYLNNKTLIKRQFVLYWMQASQRVCYNHALSFAIEKANHLGQPLIVFFSLTDDYPDANIRHYQFMLEGIKEVESDLKKMGIKLVIRFGNPVVEIQDIVDDVSVVITDKGYLKIERYWREQISQLIDIPLIEIESNVVVPVEAASLKEEYSAYTLRRKIEPLIDYYAKAFKNEDIMIKSLDFPIVTEDLDLNDLSFLKTDKTIKPSLFKGGHKHALETLNDFINHKIDHYSKYKNHPELDFQSNLSPYLHFGQISPIEIYLLVRNLNADSFIEELIVRRELAINFVYYNKDYDSYLSLPSWAIDTLEKHNIDEKEYSYSVQELEEAKTHDLYWNACQTEMVLTGKMHGYMRMYWGKKVLEWTNNYQHAYQILIYLNNKYSLDGRDPNGYAGIAWCFGKHDRPWKERNIFGYIRYMNQEGLKRKFNMNLYLDKINKMK